jgi:hypothetical protein
MKKLLVTLVLVSVFQSTAWAATPIGGIIVKGGKNPGGQMVTRVSDDINGLIRFEGKAGEKYTVKVETGEQEFEMPENGILELQLVNEAGTLRVIPFKGNRKGWDGTVKGGKANPKGGEDGSIDANAQVVKSKSNVKNNRSGSPIVPESVHENGQVNQTKSEKE